MSPLIELHDITKDYGQFRALDRVNVQIAGGVTGLLGPNGAGKSTMIKVLLGLLQASSGYGEVLGFELGRESRQIRAQVGYMPEDDCYLAGLTGIECVQLAAQLSRFPALEGLRRAHEILDFCGAGQERYRTVETYSTGMRQKLRFAQALVHDPPLLILDEPTSGMDPEEREAMLNRIQVLAQRGKAVLLCTHILPDVQAVSDAVVILARGRVRVSDKLETLSAPADPAIHIRVSGDSYEFCRLLEQRGLSVEHEDNGQLTARGNFGDLPGIVWWAAGESSVTVRSLVPARNSLEQIFLDAVMESPDAAA